MFAAEIRTKRVGLMRSPHWRRHLDEVFVKVDGVPLFRRVVDPEGKVEADVSNQRDTKAVLKIRWAALRRHDQPQELVTGQLRSYGAAPKEIGAARPAPVPVITART